MKKTLRTVGLVTEYNPFHNGHLYHLQQSKKLADAEVAVAVMSGNFLQRGELALCDKWHRAEMALAAGVDIVIELPFIFACNSAPHFARGAVQSLDALGGIDALCFGSEAGHLGPLRGCADLLEEQSAEIEKQTQKLLRQGVSYPAARARIMHNLSPSAVDTNVLAAPNNILGIEYLRALWQLHSPIKALTVARMGAGYHELQGQDEIASATGIRRMLTEGEAVAHYLPVAVARRLKAVMGRGGIPDENLYLRFLLARILRGAKSLKGVYQLEAGLENRLFEVARQATTLGELVAGIKARQLTRTRVQRVLCQLLNDVDDELAQQLLQRGPLYLHLLGCSRAGEKFLAASRNARRLPLVGNYSRIHNQLRRFYGANSLLLALAESQLQLELRASNNYALLQKGGIARRQGDYFEPVRRPH